MVNSNAQIAARLGFGSLPFPNLCICNSYHGSSIPPNLSKSFMPMVGRGVLKMVSFLLKISCAKFGY